VTLLAISNRRAGGAWTPASGAPELTDGAVHVWQANLATVADEAVRLLSDQERQRAARIIDSGKARLWARARAVLRALLADYLGRDPRKLRIAAEIHGKPCVLVDSTTVAGSSEADPGSRLDFNLSHSGDIALFALTASGPVGVDVELACRRRLDVAGVAARAFGTDERERLRKLPAREGELELLRLWVRREATMKCLGSSLVAGGSHEGAEGNPNPQPWLAELDVGPRGAAAVALQRCPRELHCWAWRPDRPPALD
jgi:4'-phosphopantetheinyl transferase